MPSSILLSMILYCPYALAQSGRYGSMFLIICSSNKKIHFKPPELEGSPYIHDSFFLGKVITTKGVLILSPCDLMRIMDGWSLNERRNFYTRSSSEVMKIEMPAETYTVEAFLDHANRPGVLFLIQ